MSKGQRYLKEQALAKDPILDSSSESEGNNANSDDGSGSGESSEDENEFEFPREDGAALMQLLHREVTNLSNMEDNTKRKFALIKLY